MHIDNFETIAKNVLKFTFAKSYELIDTFYEIRILKPNEEGRFSLVDSSSHFKSYYPRTNADVLKLKDEISTICSALGYKAVININGKTMSGVSLELLKMLAIHNADSSIKRIRPWELLNKTIDKSHIKYNHKLVVTVPTSISKSDFITEANKIVNESRLKRRCRTELENPSMNYITSTKDDADLVYDNTIAVIDKNESSYNVVMYKIMEYDELETILRRALGTNELIVVDESGWCPLFEA